MIGFKSTRQIPLIAVILLQLLSVFSLAQTIPVGTVGVEDVYRSGQLSGNIDPTISFTVRPLSPSGIREDKTLLYNDSAGTNKSLVNIPTSISADNGRFYLALLPISYQIQTNSHHPYGWNDGAMIPAKGLQTMLSAGMYARYGPLSVQLRPEWVNAVNSEFETFDKDHYDIIFARYYNFYNQIDAPARFGTKRYRKLFLGQSNVKLNYKEFSIGFSSENLWWGPGMRNSLVMSNNAPGFNHFTFNTNKPVKTAIGSFEGQIIAGRLEGSGFGVLEPEKYFLDGDLYVPKKDDWRLLSGMVLSWQPKWVPGLFVGFTRAAQIYHDDINGIGNYLPFFSSIKKATADEALYQRDKRSSLFLRWLWKEEQGEIYFEYGTHNNNRSLRDVFLQPNRNRAYIFGLRKLLNLPLPDQKLLISTEIAQLQQTELVDIMNTKSWYLNPYIRHGYTNRGQVLGAGIGPGANSQSLEVSWLKGLKRLGIQLERYVHNNDFYTYAYIDSQDPRRHWTDLSLAASGVWDYKNLLFNAKLMAVKSINYQWYLLEPPNSPTYWVNGRDAFNWQFQLGLSYRF